MENCCATVECICVCAKNAGQPTPSVSVAFKYQQELKLVFSSDLDEEWISWPEKQLKQYVSSVLFDLLSFSLKTGRTEVVE